MEPARMLKRRHVLLLGFGQEQAALTGRLILLTFRPLHAADVDGAVSVLGAASEPVRAALLPVGFAGNRLVAELARLRRQCGPISFVATGPKPDEPMLHLLRRAEVRLCLWEKIEDSALRFVLNRALFDDLRGQVRKEQRVPTSMVARVFSASGEKPVLVYNLSNVGAYLETHRPTGVGGHVQVELPLPSGKITLPACVVSTNVPGNLQRPNLPLGMGVDFLQVPEEARAALSRYVEARARTFEL
jgi:hypothetical protein